MFLSKLIPGVLAAPLASAFLVSPPAGSTAAPATATDCSAWVVPAVTDTCATITTKAGITLAAFEKANPIVGSACQIIFGFAYCIQENFGVTTTSATTTSGSSSSSSSSIPTSTTLVTSTTTTSGNGISTPLPVQTGITSSCDSFHLVISGDECGTIATNAGISLAQFLIWNPAVGSTCAFLDLGDFVCINVIGGTTSTSVSVSTTTTAGNGITTPTPFQAGLVSNCNTFHFVVSGDECGTIATNAGISLANFELWNPAVGSTCAFLDLGDWVCINVIGGSTTSAPPPTSTAPGNGITTPTPFQAGLVSNCNTFHFVVSGDQCGTIATNAGISLANFELWNPAVGSTCAFLDLGDWVCINVIGGTTTTAPPPTSTSAGNGIATPTPIQAGMVTNCNKFHLVVANDQCGLIATAAGITLANFILWNPAVGSSCSFLDLGDWACIGIL